MDIHTIIGRKRDKAELTPAEIEFFIGQITGTSVSDAQLSAFIMAVYLNGLNIEETASMCTAMRDSGQCLSWQDVDGPVVDKHSTGGVGDSVSLMLAPILAACGMYVPMISGRGLGHTGGTIDKLGSIPGYYTEPDIATFQSCVKQVGAAIVSQSASLAPADRRMYAIRDETSTIDSLPLIVASILSKKLAEGLDALVLDIKVGNGAFITSEQQAQKLIDWFQQVANRLGLNMHCVTSQMDLPMSFSVGNALEMHETIEYLKGERRHPYLDELVRRLATQLLLTTKHQATFEAASESVTKALDSGAAAEKFAQMVHFLGGPTDLLESPKKHFIQAPVIRPVISPLNGTISGYDMKAIGELAMQLGAGRTPERPKIDHRVGLTGFLPVETPVNVGTPIVWIHAESETSWDWAEQYFIKQCIRLT